MVQNWPQISRMRAPFLHQKSTLAPKPTFGCTLVALWLPFGTLWAPFWSLLGSFWCLLASFGSLLAPFLYLFAPLAPCCYVFRYISVTFFNFEFVLAFYTFGLLGVPFLVALPMQIQFLSTQPRRNPQQNYWRISTVGTQTFLGPGRVCCRRQLKINE